MFAVAQDGDVIAEREEFLDPVRDVDEGDAAGLEFADEFEQFGRLGGGQ